jgi:hypothetical protein
MKTRDVAMAIVLETGAPRNHAVCVVAMIFSQTPTQQPKVIYVIMYQVGLRRRPLV